MRKFAHMSVLLALTCFTLLFLRAQSLPESAIVTGRVLDAESQPVPGAKISIFPSVAFSGMLPCAVTGQDGRYRLVSPPYGEAWLSAVKQDAGYPDTNALLFAPEVDTRPTVVLSPGSRLEVDIHLGHPYGTFEGSVTDGKTGAVVKNARITMHREKPESMYSATVAQDGHFIFALPAVPIEISISAPGYLPWQFRDAQRGTETLVLQSSDHRVIRVELTTGK